MVAMLDKAHRATLRRIDAWASTINDRRASIAVTVEAALAMDLVLSMIGKVSPYVVVRFFTTADGKKKRKNDALKNSIGHRHGRAFGGCADSTPSCESACYVDAVLNLYKAVSAVLLRNLSIISALSTEDHWQDLSAKYVVLLRKSLKAQQRVGVAVPIFRWHWSGDVINEWHARAIAHAAAQVPDLQQWIYTRSFFALPILCEARNMRVLFSADRDNAAIANTVRSLYSDVQIAWLDDDAKRTYNDDALVCPASKQVNVVSNPRSASGNSGICAKCLACVTAKKKRDIVFPIH